MTSGIAPSCEGGQPDCAKPCDHGAARSPGLLFSMVVVILGLVSCGDEPEEFVRPDVEVCLQNRFDGRYCIDVYEAARLDSDATTAGADEKEGPVSLATRLPWTNITWQGALDACRAKGKRLCEREEWLDACDGVVGSEGTMFTYGDDIDSMRCNTDGKGVGVTGARGNCKAATGTFDQSGNVWEWTGNTLDQAMARGGSYKSSLTHHCISPENLQVGDVIKPDGDTSPEVGFRCCRDF
jgi:formylglycine-generating enzyme required for sulfatase activity